MQCSNDKRERINKHTDFKLQYNANIVHSLKWTKEERGDRKEKKKIKKEKNLTKEKQSVKPICLLDFLEKRQQSNAEETLCARDRKLETYKAIYILNMGTE